MDLNASWWTVLFSGAGLVGFGLVQREGGVSLVCPFGLSDKEDDQDVLKSLWMYTPVTRLVTPKAGETEFGKALQNDLNSGF